MAAYQVLYPPYSELYGGVTFSWSLLVWILDIGNRRRAVGCLGCKQTAARPKAIHLRWTGALAGAIRITLLQPA